MSDPDVALWTPVIEMLDSLDSARAAQRYAEEAAIEFGVRSPWVTMWRKRSEWHMANAVGWASR